MEKPVVTILCRTGGESQKRKFPLDYPPGIWYYIRCIQYAPVAQLDRASDSDSEGRAFEPHRAYQSRHGFHGGIFCVQAISNKTVQNRFPHKRFLFITGWSFVFTEPRDRSQKGTPDFSRVLFEFVPQAAHRSSSLFTFHSSLAPNAPPFIIIDLIKEGASPW